MPRQSGFAGPTGMDSAWEPPADGCRALWASVISTAIQDALRLRKGRGLAPAVSDAGQAVSFLTDRTGRWAEARELIADAAGLDPEALRERAVAALGGEDDLSPRLVRRRGPTVRRSTPNA